MFNTQIYPLQNRRLVCDDPEAPKGPEGGGEKPEKSLRQRADEFVTKHKGDVVAAQAYREYVAALNEGEDAAKEAGDALADTLDKRADYHVMKKHFDQFSVKANTLSAKMTAYFQNYVKLETQFNNLQSKPDDTPGKELGLKQLRDEMIKQWNNMDRTYNEYREAEKAYQDGISEVNVDEDDESVAALVGQVKAFESTVSHPFQAGGAGQNAPEPYVPKVKESAPKDTPADKPGDDFVA